MKILLINNKKLYRKWGSKTYEYKMNAIDNDKRFHHICIEDLKNCNYEELLKYEIIVFGWNTIPISKYYTIKHNIYKKTYKNLENEITIKNLIEPLLKHPKKYYLVQDLHNYDCKDGMKGLSNYLKINKFKGIITPYKYASEISKFKDLEILYLPHHIDENKFKDFQLEKKYDIFLFGNIQRKHYPFRFRLSVLLKIISEKHNLNFLHWEEGVGVNYFQFNEKICNENLSKIINQSWMTVCTKSKYNFLLGKYFETSMSNSTILGDIPQDGKEIWKDNIIEINNTMSDNKIEKILLNAINNKELLTQKANNSKKIMEEFYLSNFSENFYNLFFKI